MNARTALTGRALAAAALPLHWAPRCAMAAASSAALSPASSSSVVPRRGWSSARLLRSATTATAPTANGTTAAASAPSTAPRASTTAAPRPYPAATGGGVSSSRLGGGSVRTSAAKKSPPPSLKEFMLRAQVLSLYRNTLRLSRRCSSPEQRAETCAHARQQIEAMRGASEMHHIRALLQEGNRQLQSLETMLNLTK